MKVHVTGAGGQLGSEIRDLCPGFNKDYSFDFSDIDSLDITDQKAMDKYFQKNSTDIVINCAAYTAVDRAQSEKNKAMLINEKACSILSGLSIKYGFMIFHISTDFVFNGKKSLPYVETDLTGPLSVYGLTKLGGEKRIISKAKSYIIIRTSWLYSSHGNNFVKTIIRAAGERNEVRVVYDQTGTPTYARDLADAILKMLPGIKPGTKEIYHYSNEGVASWYDFAKSICELRGIKTPVLPIKTGDYPAPAKRPPYSVLSKEKIKREFGIVIPYWRDSLKECLKGIKNG